MSSSLAPLVLLGALAPSACGFAWRSRRRMSASPARRALEREPALPPSLKLRRIGALTVRVKRGDGAGLAEEREVIQRPRRRPEDGRCVSDGAVAADICRECTGGARATG